MVSVSVQTTASAVICRDMGTDPIRRRDLVSVACGTSSGGGSRVDSATSPIRLEAEFETVVTDSGSHSPSVVSVPPSPSVASGVQGSTAGAGSLSAEEADFRVLIEHIRTLNMLEEPVVTDSVPTGVTALARARGLAQVQTPSLRLPISPITDEALRMTRESMVALEADRDLTGLLPAVMTKARRWYRTTDASFGAPFSVPKVMADLMEAKEKDISKPSVVLAPSHVSSLETALCSVGEAVSWVDWWMAAIDWYRRHVPDEHHEMFTKLMVSGSKAVEFISKVNATALTNLVLTHWDTVLSRLPALVPVGDAARLRLAPLPSSSHLFPKDLTLEVLQNKRVAETDAAVRQAIAPKRIPLVPQAQRNSSVQKTHPGAGVSPVVPPRGSTSSVNYQASGSGQGQGGSGSASTKAAPPHHGKGGNRRGKGNKGKRKRK